MHSLFSPLCRRVLLSRKSLSSPAPLLLFDDHILFFLNRVGFPLFACIPAGCFAFYFFSAVSLPCQPETVSPPPEICRACPAPPSEKMNTVDVFPTIFSPPQKLSFSQTARLLWRFFPFMQEFSPSETARGFVPEDPPLIAFFQTLFPLVLFPFPLAFPFDLYPGRYDFMLAFSPLLAPFFFFPAVDPLPSTRWRFLRE